jgi:type I restriction enzyme S subunit
MCLKPYCVYKDTGIPWIGMIPSHWELQRGKYLFVERSEKGFSDEPLLAATQTKGVVLKQLYENRTVLPQTNLESFKLVKKNDFVISLRSFQGGIEKAYFRGIISPAYTVFSLNNGLDANYFQYLAKSKPFIDLLKNLVIGIRQGQNIDYDQLKRNFFYIPLIDEQVLIARYINFKLAKISKFILNKQKLIALLKEQKQNIINQAVTRGLNPDVKLKPSGVDWLGDIPEHWEVRRLKSIAFIVLGKMLKPTPSIGDQLKFYLRSANIQWLNPDVKDVSQMWFSEKELKQYCINKYDLLVSEGGEVGRTCIWQDELEESYIQNSVHKITVNTDISPLFILYQFSKFASLGLFKGIANRVSIAHLTKEKLVIMPFCKTSLEEQNFIVEYIARETSAINRSILHNETSIKLIKEYRDRLISDAVTGQIDVCNIEVPDVSEEELVDFANSATIVDEMANEDVD